jgi:hypothetical protein
MSSILEALKELEGDRARATKRATSVADVPRAPERSLGALIPLTGGLAIGVLAFGFYALRPALTGSPPAAPSAPPEIARDDPQPPRGPEWLERAEAPRARVTPLPGAVTPSKPTAATPEPAPAAEAPAPDRAATKPAAAQPKAAAARGAGDRQVQLEVLGFSSHVHERTVTLLVNGRRATLHQGEALGGVEVQLIMADGVYLQRGSEVFFVNAPR